MNSPASSYLVSTDWLAAHLADPALRIFDCTGMLDASYCNTAREAHYDRQHIPGAAFLDIASPKGELADPAAPLPFTWPAQARFEAAMGRNGVDNGCRVILYAAPSPGLAGSGVFWATRAWWLMHHFGVDCALLDGGWQKWLAEGRPVSSVPQAYPAATFTASPSWPRGLARKADVLEAVTTGSACILDSLSPESYRGEVDKAYGAFGQRKGHISGARNVHFATMTDANGCFLDTARLRQRFEQGGVDLQGRIITYCGGGVGATMTGFALKLLGHDDVALYDGSLMEWSNDPALPMTDPTQA